MVDISSCYLLQDDFEQPEHRVPLPLASTITLDALKYIHHLTKPSHPNEPSRICDWRSRYSQSPVRGTEGVLYLVGPVTGGAGACPLRYPQSPMVQRGTVPGGGCEWRSRHYQSPVVQTGSVPGGGCDWRSGTLSLLWYNTW